MSCGVGGWRSGEIHITSRAGLSRADVPKSHAIIILIVCSRLLAIRLIKQDTQSHARAHNQSHPFTAPPLPCRSLAHSCVLRSGCGIGTAIIILLARRTKKTHSFTRTTHAQRPITAPPPPPLTRRSLVHSCVLLCGCGSGTARAAPTRTSRTRFLLYDY